MSHGAVPSHPDVRGDVLAHLGHYLGTIGFFVPAVILIGIVVGAVVRDRRLHARDADEDHAEDDAPATDVATPPRAD